MTKTIFDIPKPQPVTEFMVNAPTQLSCLLPPVGGVFEFEITEDELLFINCSVEHTSDLKRFIPFLDGNRKRLQTLKAATAAALLLEGKKEDFEGKKELSNALVVFRHWMVSILEIIHAEEFLKHADVASIKSFTKYMVGPAPEQELISMPASFQKDIAWFDKTFMQVPIPNKVHGSVFTVFRMTSTFDIDALEQTPEQFFIPYLCKLLENALPVMAFEYTGDVLKEKDNVCEKKIESAKRKSEVKLDKLTKTVEKQKEENKRLLKKLSQKGHNPENIQKRTRNELEAEFARKLNMADAGFNQERKQLLNEIETLRAQNERYKQKLTESKISVQDMEPEVQTWEPDLARYHVLFVGGHPNFTKKLKEKYPDWFYFDDESPATTLPQNADFIIYYTEHCSHRIFGQVQTWNKKRKTPIYYAYGMNVMSIETKIKNFIQTTSKIPVRPILELERA